MRPAAFLVALAAMLMSWSCAVAAPQPVLPGLPGVPGLPGLPGIPSGIPGMPGRPELPMHPRGPGKGHGPADHDVHCHNGPDVLSPAKCAELCVKHGSDGGNCVHGSCVCLVPISNLPAVEKESEEESST